ncbi:MAG: formylmethanofuran dehydrogenase [Methylotenera sp.]|nr:formylmethanofuran dehydrogenase [Methylotenera sp.]
MKTSNDISSAINFSCPACGLLCDDVNLVSISPISIKNGCTKSLSFFEQAYSNKQGNATLASLFGKATDLNTAIKAAAKILSASKQPLFAGLGTEVTGMRAVMRLAEKTGATLDHMHSEGTVRNTLTLQNGGWQNTTLTEVKNRATLILAIGTDIVSSHPRFFEKLVWNSNSMFDKPSPEVIYLGVAAENTKAGISPSGTEPLVIEAGIEKLPEIINALQALMNNKNPLHKKPATEQVGGVAIASLLTILEKLKTAKYAVVVWAAGNFKYTHAELTIQSITQLIAKFNETSRIAGLPLNAGDGDLSVNNTSTWLSGFPTRNRFTEGKSEYDAYYFSSPEQLKSCDALLWISTFNAHLPTPINIPTIVIGHPNMQFERAPDVFIPVGIPGIDHIGTMARMDNVVSLPLKKIRESTLPALSNVIAQINDSLT